MLNSACMCSKDAHRENKKIATIGVCTDDALLAIRHDACLDSRSPRFAARWNETTATLLFYHSTRAKRLKTSEPSDLTGNTPRPASSPTPQRHELLDKNQETERRVPCWPELWIRGCINCIK